MADYGSSYADKRQKIVELRIQRVYKEAQKDLQKKAEEYLKKHEKRDIQMRAALKAGKITKENYQNWQMGQVFIGKQWESKVNHATEVMLHSNERALGMIRGEQYNVYSENANYQAFQIERDTRGGISFDIYDEDTVRRLITETPELLPPKMINGKRDRAWNQGIIANSITQGIIQGESIPQIAKRMANDTGYHNMKAMTRYARTAMTAAQNAGRIDTMHRAQGMGLKIKKVWIAAHDSRVRDAHADLDGESVDVDEPFSNSIGEIDYPGDPEADGANVWNCRCSLGYEYPDEEEVEEIKEEQEEDPEVDDEEYEDMDYEEWKEMKETAEEEEEEPEEKQEELEEEALDASEEYENDIRELEKEAEELQAEYQETFVRSIEAFGTDEYDEINRRLDEINAQVAEIYNEIDKKKEEYSKWLSTEAEADMKDIFGEISGKHSMRDDAYAVNRLEENNGVTQNNCSYCSLAYDARRRGYDCYAPKIYGATDTQIEKFWEDFRFSRATSYYSQDAANEIRQEAEKWGVGARGIVVVDYSRTRGHAFCFEVDSRGKCIFVDGQTGSMDATINFDNALSGSIKYGRTDDKKITKSALLYLREGDKK